MADLRHSRKPGLIRWDVVFPQRRGTLKLCVARTRGVRQGTVLGKHSSEFQTLVDQQRDVAAIIPEQIVATSTPHGDHLLSALPIHRKRHAL